jgi:hypothetical protein
MYEFHIIWPQVADAATQNAAANHGAAVDASAPRTVGD